MQVLGYVVLCIKCCLVDRASQAENLTLTLSSQSSSVAAIRIIIYDSPDVCVRYPSTGEYFE